MRVLKKLGFAIGFAGLACAVGGWSLWGGLSRGDAEDMLKERFQSSCRKSLKIVDGGGARIHASGKLKELPGSAFDMRKLVVAVPKSDDMWVLVNGDEFSRMGDNYVVVRLKDRNYCLPSTFEVTSIIDGPSEALKGVEYLEKVTLPPELKEYEGYVYTQYKTVAAFMKTDDGWRIQQ